MAQLLTLQDFSGGITDYYLDAELNRYKRADNLLLFKHGKIAKLITRPGSTLYYSANPQLPSGNQRVGSLYYLNDTLFARSGENIYRDNGTGWTELVGPVDSNELLPATADDETNLTHDYWQNHLFITDSDFHAPSKIFNDGANFQLRTAGLPEVASGIVITPDFNDGATYLYKFIYKYEYTVGTLTYVDRGPIGGSFYTVANAYTNLTLQQNEITNIPVLSNGTTTNYDTGAGTGVKVEIYRTTNNGTLFYYVGQVNNGTTTYTDSLHDNSLVNNETLYTTGGVVENNPPPLSKLVHVSDDKAYWANVKIGSEERPNRLYQSIPSDPDSVPETFFIDVDDAIIGLSSVRGRPILLCENSVHRVDGNFDELGRGAMTSQEISRTSSCVSASSVVQTLEGVFWAGRDGFYFTDGFMVLRVNDGFERSYATIIDTDLVNSRITGHYDRKGQRIWWTCKNDLDSTDNDYCYILDLNFAKGSDMPFTTAVDNGYDSWQPTSLIFIDGDMVRGDSRGYIFQHDDIQFADPLVDLGVTPSDWEIEPIQFNFITAATTFGNAGTRKMVTRTGIISDNESNLSLQINNLIDDGRKVRSTKPIRQRGALIWGDNDALWGDDSIIWGLEGVIDQWRRVPSNTLRCNYHQVQLKNAFVAIYNSDTIDTCTVDANNSKATITDTASFDWPSNVVNYYISFASDGYVKEYLITARTADEITFKDTSGFAVDASEEGWVIRGVPKGEVLSLVSLSMHYETFGRTQDTYDSSSSYTGENS